MTDKKQEEKWDNTFIEEDSFRGLGFFFGVVVGGLVAVALGVAVAVLWLIF